MPLAAVAAGHHSRHNLSPNLYRLARVKSGLFIFLETCADWHFLYAYERQLKALGGMRGNRGILVENQNAPVLRSKMGIGKFSDNLFAPGVLKVLPFGLAEIRTFGTMTVIPFGFGNYKK